MALDELNGVGDELLVATAVMGAAGAAAGGGPPNRPDATGGC